ncbi:MAG: hypothetical protein VBE63_20855 [Lamprobacter sp.]|nr:hypothetical protein [Lamprobacter sp.]MEA3642369.1 hypothetical protein [Lamprobacter sp.]
MLTLLDYCDTAEQGKTLHPARPQRQVIGIGIRALNRMRILHEFDPRIT